MSERMGRSITARLRAETAEALGWIAERLAMGTRSYLNHLLYRLRKLGGNSQYQELTLLRNPRPGS